MVYSEQLNMFSGVCKRTISITVFEELQQAGVFVYDTNKKQIYDVHKQKKFKKKAWQDNKMRI